MNVGVGVDVGVNVGVGVLVNLTGGNLLGSTSSVAAVPPTTGCSVAFQIVAVVDVVM